LYPENNRQQRILTPSP